MKLIQLVGELGELAEEPDLFFLFEDGHKDGEDVGAAGENNFFIFPHEGFGANF